MINEERIAFLMKKLDISREEALELEGYDDENTPNYNWVIDVKNRYRTLNIELEKSLIRKNHWDGGRAANSFSIIITKKEPTFP